jgi:hypothetical protein
LSQALSDKFFCLGPSLASSHPLRAPNRCGFTLQLFNRLTSQLGEVIRVIRAIRSQKFSFFYQLRSANPGEGR